LAQHGIEDILVQEETYNQRQKYLAKFGRHTAAKLAVFLVACIDVLKNVQWMLMPTAVNGPL